jgi:ABC-type uncharacterized transport system ATPase subunit
MESILQAHPDITAVFCGNDAMVMGAGRTELFETLFGLPQQNTKGKITVNEVACKFKNPTDAIKSGLAFTTEDRKHEGLVLSMTVRENLTLTTLKEFEKGLFIDEKTEENTTENYIKTLNIKTSTQNNWFKIHPKFVLRLYTSDYGKQMTQMLRNTNFHR